jgi:hypothetical protein
LAIEEVVPANRDDLLAIRVLDIDSYYLVCKRENSGGAEDVQKYGYAKLVSILGGRTPTHGSLGIILNFHILEHFWYVNSNDFPSTGDHERDVAFPLGGM